MSEGYRFVERTRPVEGRHRAFSRRVEGTYLFDPPEPGLDAGRMLAEYKRGTARLREIIADAVRHTRELRAHGSQWSLSEFGLCKDRLINTKMLRTLRFNIHPDVVHSGYRGDSGHLRFIECGESIASINAHLFAQGLSLKTCGSNDGQTLVGALSTGTHGSAFNFGAIPECVVGLHVVAGPNRHCYLQRRSAPVVTSAFARHLEAEFIEDDDLFDAALVSFGCMGIIRGALIETRPRFILHAARFRHSVNDALRAAATNLDLSGIDLRRAPLPPGTPTDRPYHFQVYFNPNEGTPPREATVLMLFEDDWERWADGYQPPVWDDGQPVPGAAGIDLIGSLYDAMPPFLAPAFVPELNRQIGLRLRPSYSRAVLGDLFRGEKAEGKLQVTGTAMPMDRVVDAWDIAFRAYKDLGAILPVIISSRFVPGSRALLGFTKFERSATIELDTIRTNNSVAYLERVRRGMHEAGIPFTVHWGKLLTFLTPARLRAAYGDRLDRWLAARDCLLETDAVKRVFTNDLMRQYGLA